MPTKTWAAMHQEVLDCISEILRTGQSVSYRGRQLSMANLADLRKLEIDYGRRAQVEAGTAARSRVSYITPVI